MHTVRHLEQCDIMNTTYSFLELMAYKIPTSCYQQKVVGHPKRSYELSIGIIIQIMIWFKI